MEIATAGIALWASFYVSGIALILSLILGWVLLALMAMDILTFRLSDILTIPRVAIGLFAGWVLEPNHLLDHVIGALVGWGGLALVAMFYQLLRHRPGLGHGDAKLLAAGGAWVGWQGLTSVLLIATFTALLVVLVLRLIGRRVDADTKLAFGAFLSLAIWIVWLYGPISV
jgi:leader peptidase (prepilin peptidase)/N-methyltransferase